VALTAGTKLGPYEIFETAGAGGMGEVYRAKDTRLDRTVAIKVLPSGAADSPDLRQRLDREAKAVSSLNHPHICTLYDVGHQDGIDFLVMEYLEGETLATRLEKGPLATSELLKYAVQIADALDKAHRQGLVHRDLKPGNIMLTKSGAKLLDFGLAKLAASGDVVQGITGVTRTTPLTGEGTILGTLHYMPPEQLEGKEVDARSDIFAFGCVLYEMATGKRAFEGKSQASLIASILKEQPRSITELIPLSPPMLERVIHQCMEKDPEDRWNSAGDVRRALEWIVEGSSQLGLPALVSARRKHRERILWAAVVVLGVAAGFLAVREIMNKAPEPLVARFAIPSDPKLSSVTWPRLSPDGKTLAFTAVDSSGRNAIWIRPLNSLDAHPLVQTTGAQSGNASRPFWSPDSRQLAYFESGQLKKVSIAGGLAQLVCDAGTGSDGAWGSAGIIVFDGGPGDSIRQVPAAGGVPTAACRIDREAHETGAAWPVFLPDGEHFLFLAFVDTLGSQSLLKVGSVRTLESVVLTPVDGRPEYSSTGHVLYLRGNLMVAQPFDADALKLTGEPVPVASQVSASGDRTHFSVSDNGTLVYQRGQSAGSARLVWLDRKGDSLGAVGRVEAIGNVALSPDGGRLAYDLSGEGGTTADVWVRDLKRDVTSRLTFGPTLNLWPVWTPDGSRVYFTSNRGSSRFHVLAHNANGTGTDEAILDNDTLDLAVTDISGEGSTLVLHAATGSSTDVMVYRPAEKSLEPLVATPFTEARATLSPDGRFLAYQSNESNRPEIYVRELTPTGGKWQVSANGGRVPQWRSDGQELYYVSFDWQFIAVPLEYGAGFEIGAPDTLFTRRYLWNGNSTLRPYQVSADGQRFLVVVPGDQSGVSDFVVVQNWATELKR
jgi:serine/threonine protein kinase